MSSLDSTVQKYLALYAEPALQHLNLTQTPEFDSVLVLPIFDESTENLNRFLSLSGAQKKMMIWVFNCPDSALAKEQQRTQNVMHDYIRMFSAVELGQSADGASGVYFAQLDDSLTVYILDRCSKGREIPAKQGVGLARKLGMDLGLKLIDQQCFNGGESVAWLHSSDADVTLPPGYFNVCVPSETTSAIIYPFEHQAESGFEQSMALYDFSLRYYVGQLKQAGSPYAFHTIGSLIAVTPLAYAQVRGMPKRAGAEDFYLLNKLAKVGQVVSLGLPVIQIRGRPSHRVPFGTGPSLVKLQEMDDSLAQYVFYHPEIFCALKHLLAIISEAAQPISSAVVLFGLLSERMPKEMAEHAISSLTVLNIEKQFMHLSQKKTAVQFIQGFHTWFDAFISLRFIHEMRDLAYPSVNFSALKQYLNSSGVDVESYSKLTNLGI